MYQTKITSQGTISIPSALRKKYNLKTGEVVTLKDGDTIQIIKSTDFEDLWRDNAQYIKHPIAYKNGDGFTMYVKEKYGK